MVDISRVEIKNEALKYGTYKAKTEKVIDYLQNRSRDLGENIQSFKRSLENLEEDVLQEERRQEKIRNNKEEERRRKADISK